MLKFAALLVGAALIGAVAAWPNWNQPTRLTFLSVGQGDCAVFQTGGHTILIDVGPNLRGNDAGKRIIMPDLRRMGIDSIDLILLSHPDVDHIGGLASVLRGEPVGKVCLSDAFSHYEPLLRHLNEDRCTNVMWLGPGQKARVGDFTLEVDCPEWHEGQSDNDGSEFVKLTGDGSSAVFTGDAGASAEARMMRDHDWSAQVLKLGHHGSKTASSEAFLEAVHPQWAVVSCGHDNPYGHPHREVLDRVQKLGIKLARTDTDGDVTFELGAHGWERRL